MALLQTFKTIAVIPHFHRERKDNLEMVVESLNCGSMKPDRVVIFNNNPDYALNVPGAICINSGINLGSSIRYSVAYTMGAEIFIGVDDDIMVGGEDVERLVVAVDKNPDSVIGFSGSLIVDETNPYLNRLSYNSVHDIQEIDIVLGRVNAMSRRCLSRYMDAIKALSFFDYGNHEDIPLSLANKKAGFKNYLIPLSTKELPTGGVGLELEPNHFLHRNGLARR